MKSASSPLEQQRRGRGGKKIPEKEVSQSCTRVITRDDIIGTDLGVVVSNLTNLFARNIYKIPCY